MKQPVIILGMHRSGTTMLTKILSQLGLFVGQTLDGYHEAMYFQKINTWLMKQVNSSWDNPYNFTHLDDFTRSEMVRVCNYHLQSYFRYKYLGRENFLKYKNIQDLDFLWGWKDPRNVYTLDVWKEIFPNPKVIHIYRNPIDIAASLRKREQFFEENMKTNWTGSINEKLLRSVSSFSHAVRVANIYEGIKLWEEYVTQSFFICQNFDSIHIRYESFLDNPIEYLTKVVDFIDLEIDQSEVVKTAYQIDKTRQFAFINDKELKKIYHDVKQGNALFEKCDYMDIVS